VTENTVGEMVSRPLELLLRRTRKPRWHSTTPRATVDPQ
jgi:hypothetical protein